jgi:hypothetical protein
MRNVVLLGRVECALSGIRLDISSVWVWAVWAAIWWCRTNKAGAGIKGHSGRSGGKKEGSNFEGSTARQAGPRGPGANLAGGCGLTQVGRQDLSRSASGVQLGWPVVRRPDSLLVSSTPTSTARISTPKSTDASPFEP